MSIACLVTILSGLSFLIGYIITVILKNNNKLVTFSLGFSFIVIFGLIIFDLLPECLELIDNKFVILIFVLIGIIILKLLDYFIPDHDHDSNKKDHMEHIGLISFVALFIHNIIESTAIYTTSLTTLGMGVIMAIGVSFHNIPLGIQISTMIKNKKVKALLMIGLSLSSIIGIILLNIFKITLNSSILCALISVTLGMLIYIALFELLCEVKENIRKKELQLGLISGVILVALSQLL